MAAVVKMRETQHIKKWEIDRLVASTSVSSPSIYHPYGSCGKRAAEYPMKYSTSTADWIIRVLAALVSVNHVFSFRDCYARFNHTRGAWDGVTSSSDGQEERNYDWQCPSVGRNCSFRRGHKSISLQRVTVAPRANTPAINQGLSNHKHRIVVQTLLWCTTPRANRDT